MLSKNSEFRVTYFASKILTHALRDVNLLRITSKSMAWVSFFWIMPTTTLCHSFASLEDRSEERSDEESSICPQIVDSSLSRLAGSLRMTSEPKKRHPYPGRTLKINRLGFTMTWPCQFGCQASYLIIYLLRHNCFVQSILSQYFWLAGMGLENSKLLEPVHHFTIIFAYVRIPMSKLKLQDI
jgi:hypothetical protein